MNLFESYFPPKSEIALAQVQYKSWPTTGSH